MLHPRVSSYARTSIGSRTIVHSGAVIGADGFGMAEERGRWLKIPQIGGVVVGDDVEIGANTTIDRGALDDTVIEDDVKLDNQIQIGHNCRIGAHTAIAGCTGIAGSTVIGRNCRIGGAAMIVGHIEIADNVSISGATCIIQSIKEPGLYTSVFPALPNREWRYAAPPSGDSPTSSTASGHWSGLRQAKRETKNDGIARHRQDSGASAASLPVSSDRPCARVRAGEPHSRVQKRHHQRTLLRRPLSRAIR